MHFYVQLSLAPCNSTRILGVACLNRPVFSTSPAVLLPVAAGIFGCSKPMDRTAIAAIVVVVASLVVMIWLMVSVQ